MQYYKEIGALFDLDGVLVDTETSYTGFYESLDRIYPTGVEKFPYVIKGTTLDSILSKYFPDKEIQTDVVRRLHEHEANMAYPIYAGVLSLLDDLDRFNVPAAIVTSSDQAKMDCLYKRHPNFIKRFAAIITAKDVSRSKPDPEGYLLAAERIGISIDKCFVFEDSLSGLAAGMAAGATVIAVSTTLPAEMLHGKAHCVVDSIGSLSVQKLLDIRKNI